MLFMLIEALDRTTDTFVVIEPDDDAMDWAASVSLSPFEDSTYEPSESDLELPAAA